MDGQKGGEIASSTTEYDVTTRPTKYVAKYRCQTKTQPPRITVCLPRMAKICGDHEATLIAMISRLSLAELICMTCAIEYPDRRRQCKQPCTPVHFAEIMFDHTIE